MSRVRAASWVRVDALRWTVEAGGGGFVVARRGADEAGAVIIKFSLTGPQAPFGGPALARAVCQATLGDGRTGWTWLVGPEWTEESAVDAALERQAKFDPDLWIVVIEDEDGVRFIAPEPIG